MIRLTEFPIRAPYRSAVAGVAAVWAFGVAGLLLSGLLTLLRVRSELRCDEPFLGACSGEACGTVLGDAWATVLGLPLTIYASAYFVVALGLATVVLIRPTLAAAIRTALLVSAWAAVLVCLVLATYAAAWLQALCLFCVFLDGTCVGVLLAALMMHRGPVRPMLRRGATWAVLAAAGLGFVALVAGQRLTILQAHASAAAREALHPCVVALREIETPALRIASTLIQAKEPGAVPRFVAALFLDLSCAHCKAEYTFWRRYQAELAERGVHVELQLFHFPRGCSVMAEVADGSRSRACDAARAHVCMAGEDSERSLALFDRLMAAQDEPFTSDRLATIAGEFGVAADAGDLASPLFACMQSTATAQALVRHVSFAETVAELHAAPGVLLIPLEDGRPTGTAQQVQGHKPQEFYDRWFERHAPPEATND